MRLLNWLGLANRDLQNEVDEEFAFHLSERAKQLRAGGMDSISADRAAREAFGDLARYRAEALLALSAAHLRRRAWTLGALSSAAACILGLVAGAAALSHRDGLVVNGLREDVARLQGELAPFRGQGAVPLAQQVRFVTVRGAVCNPRVWTVPSDVDLTLRAMITKSGGLTPTARGEVTLTSNGRATPSSKVLTMSQWLDPDRAEIPVPGFVTIDVR